MQSDKEKTLVVMQKPCCDHFNIGIIFFPSLCLCQLIPVVDLQPTTGISWHKHELPVCGDGCLRLHSDMCRKKIVIDETDPKIAN